MAKEVPVTGAVAGKVWAEQIRAYLEHEGFSVEPDRNGDLTFLCEGLSYLICLEQPEQRLGRIFLPFVWEFQSEQERCEVLNAVDFINRHNKLVKVYSVEDSVHLCTPLLLDAKGDWSTHLLRSIRALAESRSLLVHAIRFPDLQALAPASHPSDPFD